MKFVWQYMRFVVVFALALVAILIWANGRSQADPGNAVVIMSDVPDSQRVANRISALLRDGDEIAVAVYGDTADAEQVTANMSTILLDKVLLVVVEREVYVRGNSWVPSDWLLDRRDRVQNVNRSMVDRVTAMVVEIHGYQDTHAKPAPPPPPPPPPAPPAPPEPPFDWSPYMIYIYIGVPILVLFLLWLPLELRRRRRVSAISRRADEQADWGYDKYGIKTGSDL